MRDGARENDDGPRDGRGRTRRRRRRGRGGRGGEGRDGAPIPASARARLARGGRVRARSCARFCRRPAATSMRPATWRRSKALRGRILRAANPTPTAMANPAAGVVDGGAAGAIGATAPRATAISPRPRVRISTSVPTTTSARTRAAARGRRHQPAQRQPMHRRSSPCLGRNLRRSPRLRLPTRNPRAEREPPRRRSTVREPAPVFSGSAPADSTPMTAPPPPAPVVSSTAEADGPSQSAAAGGRSGCSAA